MVGAGFSLNAYKAPGQTMDFPLWKELGEKMFDMLYPPGVMDDKSREEKKEEETYGLGVVKLASEYATAFGQPALDDLIVKSIPDDGFFPGKLHKMLLSLPWSDIFTTNYDTLLERTRPFIIERKYDVVLTKEDIPYHMKPRLVKLHGSLPSHRPFIITEEDYRTYPQKFAPFVNMVQQSLMENAFCLIGFSGDDPNFLAWTGWVRDNLGPATPNIYLLGLFDLPPSKRQMLINRKVIPVDLSSLFPKAKWPNTKLRYSKAYEWLFLYLMYGYIPKYMTWPDSGVTVEWKESHGLPKVPKPQPKKSDYDFGPEIGKAISKEDIRELLQYWKQVRFEYPGWIITPNSNREKLWRYTQDWIYPVFQYLNELEPPYDLFLLYELDWRLQRALSPLFIEWIEYYVKTLNDYNPYPHLGEVPGAKMVPNEENSDKFNWDEIGSCWVELHFSVIRESRDDLDSKRFFSWLNKIQSVVLQKPEWQAKWFHEQCLFYLNTLDFSKVKELINRWPVDKDLPFWEIKRAAIIAEIGNFEQAEDIVEESLQEIRISQHSDAPNYELLSQEGWAMLLSKALSVNKNGQQKRLLVSQYRDRWEKLSTYGSNPFGVIDSLKSVLGRNKPAIGNVQKVKQDFDTHSLSITETFTSGFTFSSFLPAFAFIRSFEEGALPVKCGIQSMFSETYTTAAEWIEPFVPLLSICSMLRAGRIKEIEDMFNRVNVAVLPDDTLDYIYPLIKNSLSQTILYTKTGNNGWIGERISVLLEFLSRLTIRLDQEQLLELLEIAIHIYKNPDVLASNYIKPFKNFFRRVLAEVSCDNICEKMDVLITLPILTEGSYNVPFPSDWPEPFEFISWSEGYERDLRKQFPDYSNFISHLNQIVKNGSAEARKRASIRLAKLYSINALNKTETSSFARSLWSRIDDNTKLPSDTYFFISSFIWLPSINREKAVELVRQCLLNMDFNRVADSVRGEFTQDLLRNLFKVSKSIFNEEEYYIEWSHQEIKQILRKAVNWWEDEKNKLKGDDYPDIFGTVNRVKRAFIGLSKFIADVIMVNIDVSDKETIQVIENLRKDMEDYNIPIIESEPFVLLYAPSEIDIVSDKIKKGLLSHEKLIVRSSINATYSWTVQSKKAFLPEMPVLLLDMIIHKIALRSQPELNVAIYRTSDIIKKYPEVFSDEQIDQLLFALEGLKKDTSLSGSIDSEMMTDKNKNIPIHERPFCRSLSAVLANRVEVELKNRKKGIPGIITEWKELSKTDVLPEVRNAWDN